MRAHQAQFPIAMMYHVLGVSKARYHAWLSRPPSAREHEDAVLTAAIREDHAES